MAKAYDKVTGMVIREIEQRNNSFRYTIEDTKGKEASYVTFDGLRIMLHYTITATYITRKSNNPKYSDTKNVIEVKYNNIITNTDQIQRLLRFEMKLSLPTIKSLIKHYGNNTLKKIVEDLPTVITENEITPEEQLDLKTFVERDVIIHYAKFFYEHNISYQNKWFQKLQDVYRGSIEQIKKRPYDLFSCKIPFETVDLIGRNLGFDQHPDRMKCFIEYLFKFVNKHGGGHLYIHHDGLKDASQQMSIDFDILIRFLLCVKINQKYYYTTYEIYHKEKTIEAFSNKLLTTEVKLPKNYNPNSGIVSGSTNLAQDRAIRMIIENNISIVTGPPGTENLFSR